MFVAEKRETLGKSQTVQTSTFLRSVEIMELKESLASSLRDVAALKEKDEDNQRRLGEVSNWYSNFESDLPRSTKS